MRSALAVLVLALALLIPTGVGAEAPPDMVVYDYTTTSAPFWTPIIRATVDEFNAVRPTTAPRLVYSAESGTFDCLDLPPQIANLAGIIICDTSRPGEFPYDPNAPKEGWAGMERRIDGDTTRIVLNSYVPEGYYRPTDDADNTVCHEMMHAYTGVGDDYGSDETSCVWGYLLSPGPTDVRHMKERWSATVVEPSRREPVTLNDPTGLEWIVIVVAITVPLVYAYTRHGNTRLLTLMVWVPLWVFVARVIIWTPRAAPLELRLRWVAVDMSVYPLTLGWPIFVVVVYGLIKLFTRLLRRRPGMAGTAALPPKRQRGYLGWGALIVTGLFVLYLVSMRAGDSPVQRAEATTIPRLAAEAADRQNCDPAYPDENTCIPSGPPLDQPCAITNERNFTVLPPDPRRLDHDGDGVGCEPISP